MFAALAISRAAQARTGVSIKRILTTLRPLRSATITIGNRQISAAARVPPEAQDILDTLSVEQGGH